MREKCTIYIYSCKQTSCITQSQLNKIMANNTSNKPTIKKIARILSQECNLAMLNASNHRGEMLRQILSHEVYLQQRLGANRGAVVLVVSSPDTGCSVRIDNVHASYRKYIVASQLVAFFPTVYDRLLEGKDVISVTTHAELSFQVLGVDARAYAWLERTFPTANAPGGAGVAQAFLKRALSRRILSGRDYFFTSNVCADSMLLATCEAPTSNVCDGCGAKRVDGIRLRPCSSCGVAYYCSVECQRQEWRKFHKSVCAGLAGGRMIAMDDWIAFDAKYAGLKCPTTTSHS